MKPETARRRQIKAEFANTDWYAKPCKLRKGPELAYRLILNAAGTHVARVEQLTEQEMEARFQATKPKKRKSA